MSKKQETYTSEQFVETAGLSSTQEYALKTLSGDRLLTILGWDKLCKQLEIYDDTPTTIAQLIKNNQ